jgi:hypothetical protein
MQINYDKIALEELSPSQLPNLVAQVAQGDFATDEITRLASRYFRTIEAVFAAAQRHTALQQQLNGASPYTQRGISVLAQDPRCEEVFSFLGEIIGSVLAGLPIQAGGDEYTPGIRRRVKAIDGGREQCKSITTR